MKEGDVNIMRFFFVLITCLPPPSSHDAALFLPLLSQLQLLIWHQSRPNLICQSSIVQRLSTLMLLLLLLLLSVCVCVSDSHAC